MKRTSIFILLGLIALCVGQTFADVSVTLYFPANDLSLSSKAVNYQFINLKSCGYTGTPKEPMLPMKTIYLSIPANEDPGGVIASVASTQSYTIANKIYPAQYPVAADGLTKSVTLAEPSAVYSIDANYPGTNANVVHSGSLGGYKIAAFTEASGKNNC